MKYRYTPNIAISYHPFLPDTQLKCGLIYPPLRQTNAAIKNFEVDRPLYSGKILHKNMK